MNPSTDTLQDPITEQEGELWEATTGDDMAREAVAEVLDALDAAAARRDDTLLSLAADALRAVHDLYAQHSHRAVVTTPPTHARRDINRTLAEALRKHTARPNTDMTYACDTVRA